MPQSATIEILQDFIKPVRTAPTLVKYAERSDYICDSRKELAAAAVELMKDAGGEARPIYPAPVVDLLDDDEDLEVEIAASLLYSNCHYSYRQLRGAVMGLSVTRATRS